MFREQFREKRLRWNVRWWTIERWIAASWGDFSKLAFGGMAWMAD